MLSLCISFFAIPPDSYHKLLCTNKIPPEYLLKSASLVKHDTRGDIYSLGVILWEISADGATPFVEPDFLTVLHILQGNREASVKGTPEEYVTLYTKCWDSDPEKRPELFSIMISLIRMLEWMDNNASEKTVGAASVQPVKPELCMDLGFAKFAGMCVRCNNEELRSC